MKKKQKKSKRNKKFKKRIKLSRTQKGKKKIKKFRKKKNIKRKKIKIRKLIRTNDQKQLKNKKDNLVLKLIKFQLSLKSPFDIKLDFSLEKYIQAFFDKILILFRVIKF